MADPKPPRVSAPNVKPPRATSPDANSMMDNMFGDLGLSRPSGGSP